MIINQITDLGNNALKFPKKYSAFFGVSIRNSYFSSLVMEGYFIWLSNQFKNTIVFLLDDPDKYNYIAFNNDPESLALDKARKMAQEKKKSYERLLSKLSIDNISVTVFKDFIHETYYIDTLKKITRYLDESLTLKEALTSMMEESIGGKIREISQKNKISTSNIVVRKNILFNYVIEELAALIYFTEKGYQIEIDPYNEFSVKKMLYENLFPDLSKQLNLTRRGHLYIYPEGHPYKKIILNQEVSPIKADAQL